MKNNVLVLGAGAWGTAIANLIANNTGEQVSIWAYEKNVFNEINKKRKNSIFLPKVKLHNSIIAINNFKKSKAKYIFVAVPSQHVRLILESYFKTLSKEKVLISESIISFISKKEFDENPSNEEVLCKNSSR